MTRLACIELCAVLLNMQVSSSALYSCPIYRQSSATARALRHTKHTLWLPTMLCSIWKLWREKFSYILLLWALIQVMSFSDTLLLLYVSCTVCCWWYGRKLFPVYQNEIQYNCIQFG